MVIPQGMAYGFLAGLPPWYGLYASLFPPLFYALLGSSMHLTVPLEPEIQIGPTYWV